MMSRVQKGLAGGVAGTVAVSLLELPNIFLNWFDPTPAVIAHVIGMDGNMAVGWALHLAIGVLLLVVFAAFKIFGVMPEEEIR